MENPDLSALPTSSNTDLQAPESQMPASCSNFDGFSEVRYVHDSLRYREIAKIDASCENAETPHTKDELATLETSPNIKNKALEQCNNPHSQLVPASALNHSNGQQYPMPLATHEAVIQDKELFLTTLNSFLAALGITLRVPKVEGKDMDLQTLYCEVTARGGLEQVIRYAQWKEIIEVLCIIPSSMSACFVLRKHYTNLLFHYEQVYFFRVDGHVKYLPVSLPAPKPAAPAADIGLPYEAPPTEVMLSLKKRNRKLDPMQVFGVDPAAAIGTMVTGAINGKLDQGYLVTILVGEEKLMGILYHAALGNKVQQFATVPSLLKGVGSDLEVPGLAFQVNGKKRRRLLHKDPNVLRTTKSGYNIFLKEQGELLKQLYPETKGLGKRVIAMWGTLPENEKSFYQARGLQEREKLKREYQERLTQQSQIFDEANNCVGRPLTEHGHVTSGVSCDYRVALDEEGAHKLETDGGRFHGNGPDAQMPAARQVDIEQVNGMQEEDEGEEENSETSLEDEEQEDEYPGVDQNYNQHDGNDYLVSNQPCYVQHLSHVNKSGGLETKIHGSLVPSKQLQVYARGHPYPWNLPRQQGVNSHNLHGPWGMIASEHVVYQQGLGNGQALYADLQRCQVDALGVLPPHLHQSYPLDGYAFPQVMQGKAGEALGLPVPSDQSTNHKQGEWISYPGHLQPQIPLAPGSNIQTRQMPSQARYPHPILAPYPQMYAWPHAYQIPCSQVCPTPVQVRDPRVHLSRQCHLTEPIGLQRQVMRPLDGLQAPAHVQARGQVLYHAQEDG